MVNQYQSKIFAMIPVSVQKTHRMPHRCFESSGSCCRCHIGCEDPPVSFTKPVGSWLFDMVGSCCDLLTFGRVALSTFCL